LAGRQRSVSTALVLVVVLGGLVAAGRWLQPRLDGQTKAATTTRPAPNSPATTSPAATSPLSIDSLAGSSGVTRVVATRSRVDAMAATRQAVWLAVGGLVLRVDPATGRALTVPGAEAVVDLEAGAGAVWAVSCQGRVRRGPLAVGSGRVGCGSMAPTAGCGGWTRRTAGRLAPSGCRWSRAAPRGAGRWWSTVHGSGSATQGLPLCGGSTSDAEPRTAGRQTGPTVWATSDARLLGLGGPQVRGPRRNLHELETDRITAMAAAGDGGLWLGTAQGLFHVDRSVLR
jgi:hypothetical protein